MTEDSLFALWGLFLSSFISSTLLPGGSEIVLATLATQTSLDQVLLISIATLGNTLGGMLTWAMGRFTIWRWPTKTFAKKYEKACLQLQRSGSPVLLFSWLPVIGDPLCFVAGWLKIRLEVALMFILLGKALRYTVITLIANKAFAL